MSHPWPHPDALHGTAVSLSCIDYDACWERWPNEKVAEDSPAVMLLLRTTGFCWMLWYSCPSSYARHPLMSEIIILDGVRLRRKCILGASWWGTVSLIDSFNLSVTTRRSHGVNHPRLQSRNETQSNLFKIVAPPGFIIRRSRPTQQHGGWRKRSKMSWWENTS